MFKNRSVLIVAVLSLTLVTVAAASPLSSTSESTKATRNSQFLDYYQRHPELRVSAENVDTTDYFARHPELGISANSVDLTDYFLRHPELRDGLTESVDTASDGASLDECFDVSLSEVAACREANQSSAP
jgi:hypothetical protein